MGPIRKMWHRVRPARMVFVEFTDGEQTITHLSNSLPEMHVSPKKDTLGENLLMIGRILTFNVIKTKQGWMAAAVIVICLVAVQLHVIGSKVLHKRRHLRALEDVKSVPSSWYRWSTRSELQLGWFCLWCGTALR